MELIPVHNLYWKKYLTYGYHSLISMWMDDFGLPVYRDVVQIIHQALILKKEGITILRLGQDKVCYVHKSEYKSVFSQKLSILSSLNLLNLSKLMTCNPFHLFIKLGLTGFLLI